MKDCDYGVATKSTVDIARSLWQVSFATEPYNNMALLEQRPAN